MTMILMIALLILNLAATTLLVLRAARDTELHVSVLTSRMSLLIDHVRQALERLPKSRGKRGAAPKVTP